MLFPVDPWWTNQQWPGNHVGGNVGATTLGTHHIHTNGFPTLPRPPPLAYYILDILLVKNLNQTFDQNKIHIQKNLHNSGFCYAFLKSSLFFLAAWLFFLWSVHFAANLYVKKLHPIHKQAHKDGGKKATVLVGFKLLC